MSHRPETADRTALGKGEERPASEALLDALGVAAGDQEPQIAAALRALAEEVLYLRCEETRLRESLAVAEALADRDGLCPVFNRRAFMRELEREMALARRHATPLCVLYLDLDQFKAVNDQLGHAQGDKALRRVCTIIEANLRDSDIIGRLGGDEFAVILSHAGLEDGRLKAEHLEARIGQVRLRPVDEGRCARPLSLGASCGVALWDGHVTGETLVAQADEAMFLAKSRRSTSET
jgi:diguanylate cyclase (GGDEF)-like protein